MYVWNIHRHISNLGMVCMKKGEKVLTLKQWILVSKFVSSFRIVDSIKNLNYAVTNAQRRMSSSNKCLETFQKPLRLTSSIQF